MTEILFYHLQGMSLESVLPPLLEKSLEARELVDELAALLAAELIGAGAVLPLPPPPQATRQPALRIKLLQNNVA